ncbi:MULTISPECIES: AAA family ATPase [unclassified Facklamia]|uniref:ATP-binding protein n=1 Tax=Aerococcaceae TaxID=186827 RepID=UPI0013B7CEB8|nr:MULTISPECIES: AAA family ATPase [unclassified Facklamia]NEW63631.1 AAA family ATPase [Facklamia sp. 252]NEW67102.1 AAA family ATPase [Facklamia sp. 253]QQD66353.1 AAA family ATPase [Aerococcaceae bacterium zg-252]
MRIKTLDIYGYGKWVNQQFEISEQLQLFYGANEAGKSTLQSFIRSILFGFPTKRKRVNQQNRYEPKQSDRYGGRILLVDTPYGDIWIERTLQGLSIQSANGDVYEPELLDTLLSGLDETLFDTFYAFNLKNLQELAKLDAEQMNDYFLSIGTVGSDQFLKGAKQFEKESDDLYRPQGHSRPLNQLLVEYDELAQRVEEVKRTLSKYDQLKIQRDEEIAQIQALDEQIKQLDLQMREQDKLIGRYDSYLKHRAATRELEGLVYTDIPVAFPEQLKNALAEMKKNEQEIAQLKEKITLIEGEIGTMTRYNWAVNHETERKKWWAETQQAKELQSKIEQLIERISEQKTLMNELAIRGQFYPEKVSQEAEYLQKVETGLNLQAQKLEFTKQEENLKAERKVYIEQRKEQQNYSAIVRSQVAKLENQRMNEEAILFEETSLNHYFLGALFFVIGLFIAVSQFIAQHDELTVLFWVGIVGIFIGLASLLSIFYNHRKKFNQFHNSPILKKIHELREKDIAYQEQSKLVGIQINQREEALEAIVLEQNNIEHLLKQWLVGIGFYPTADAEWVLKTNPVKTYFDAKKLHEKFELEKEELEQKITQWLILLQPFFERFPPEEDSTRAKIRFVEEIEAQLKVTQLRGQSLKEKISDAQQQIEQLVGETTAHQQLVNEILNQTECQNEAEFSQKVLINERIEELKEKQVLYQDQMAGFEEALALVENKQTLVEDYKRLESALEQARLQLSPHHTQRANLEVEIRYLEQDGTYQSLMQQLANKKEEIQRAILMWGTKRLAMNIIYKTLRHGIDNPVSTIVERANQIFEQLSYGRYNQIKLNQTGVKVMQFSGILFELHELSQGTLEQLYVALRLAFVESATAMVKLPVMIDDAFVNFDEYRKTSMYQVLLAFSKTTQVLFFTFDPQANETFAELPVIKLEESIAISGEEVN